MSAPTLRRERPPAVVWFGLAVVLAAAAVLSFDALRGLALAVGIADRFAWLLPIAVDAGAAVSCATWLGGRTHPDAARFAGRMTWALLGVTVLGNAGQLGMHANHITPPWWVAVLVGSIPPAVVGATVHLIVLLVRRALPELAAAPVAVPAGVPGVPAVPEYDPAPVPTTEHEAEHDDESAARRASDEEIVDYLREHAVPSRRQLNKVFICGQARYARLVAEANETTLRRVK